MDRSYILEAMYKVIKESTEWSISCNDSSYGQYIDGVVAMTDALLGEFNPTTRITEIEKTSFTTDKLPWSRVDDHEKITTLSKDYIGHENSLKASEKASEDYINSLINNYDDVGKA